MDKLTLDRDVFKALASDSRLAILKALDVRQKTVTELAKELELNKATVHEHLEKLEVAGLIQRIEEDVERKWVYWQLSWTGRRLLHPAEIKLAILLSSAGGSLAAAAAALWLWMRSGLPAGGPEAADAGASTMARGAEELTTMAEPTADPVLAGAALAFALATLALVSAAVWVHLKAAPPAQASG